MGQDAATLPTGAVVEHAIDGFSLTVTRGPDAGLRAQANSAEVTIGTDPKSDLVLTDPRVSRHHCSLTATASGILLEDHRSKNGTWVGGSRIEVGHVFTSATIEIGHTAIQLGPASAIKETLSAEPSYGAVLGTSDAMRRIFAVLPRVAASDSTVLIEGETGTGKGALARALHAHGSRASGPFVVLDCTAIPPSLVESELFGHVAGAFTGAHRDRTGAFELAKGGTIFIDEIGELPIDIQPKLLRALEERTVKPVGGSRSVQLDVRVIAATNVDLRAEVNQGTFRADLYYRLNVVRIPVPPLRKRREDIIMLARHFHAELTDGRSPSPTLLASLVNRDWPGNVRELRGAIERALLLEDLGLDGLDSPASSIRREPALRTEADPAAPREPWAFEPTTAFRDAKAAATAEWERWYVLELMRHTNGNLSKAARLVQMDRSYLRALLKKHALTAASAATDED